MLWSSMLWYLFSFGCCGFGCYDFGCYDFGRCEYSLWRRFWMLLGGYERWKLRFWMLRKLDAMLLDASILTRYILCQRGGAGRVALTPGAAARTLHGAKLWDPLHSTPFGWIHIHPYPDFSVENSHIHPYPFLGRKFPVSTDIPTSTSKNLWFYALCIKKPLFHTVRKE